MIFNISAHWDAEAQVWWAESDNLPGLVAEAATHDELIKEVRQIIPELVAANLPGLQLAGCQMRVISEQIEEVHYA
jgi:predicted RNase H-like HicB family nuclease